MEKIKLPENKPDWPKNGEIRQIGGQKYRCEYSGYTLYQWYAHETQEKGPGPGWDSRDELADKDFLLKEYGMAFPNVDPWDSKTLDNLPDLPHFKWIKVR